MQDDRYDTDAGSGTSGENDIFENIRLSSGYVIDELLRSADLRRNDILVVGCSSSEMLGETIGKGSSLEAAESAFHPIWNALSQQRIFLAAQCCEHLNRALVIERRAAEFYGLEIVSVIPQPKAGGSFATLAWRNFSDPVVVERIQAHAGLDIGGTLIGMHLKPVAVPLRLPITKIGEANIICARTRPKYIGGERAKYTEEEL